jgi:hypothetical protein
MEVKEGYIPREQRKKILLISDDIAAFSGVGTMAREIVTNSAHQLNWVNLGGAINHPNAGKRMDYSEDTNKIAEITDSSVIVYPTNGYGNTEIIRQVIDLEKPDVLMLFTDPRAFIHVFEMENEIRRKMPIIYLNVWDEYIAPLFNSSYYNSCDTLIGISKQTVNINKLVLNWSETPWKEV